jgi:hypothetical protein
MADRPAHDVAKLIRTSYDDVPDERRDVKV